MNMKIPLNELKVASGNTKVCNDRLRLFPDSDGNGCLSYTNADEISHYPSSHLFCLDLRVNFDQMPTVCVDFVEHRKDEEKILTVRYCLIPTVRVKMVAQLTELDSHRFFLPTYPGSYKGHVDGEPTSIDHIDEIRIRVMKQPGIEWVDVYSIRVLENLPDMTVHGDTLVDAMGQRIAGEWPGKMNSPEELTEYLRKEVEKAETTSSYPDNWSKYGGWKKYNFGATGYFHTHFDGKRWYLVDPDGYAFFSNGVCYGARIGVHGFVDRMEDLFEWLPSKDDPEWKDCWTQASEIPEFVKRNGKSAGEGRAMFNFARANMVRAFGAEKWWDAWVTLNTARLKKWGFNTLGVGVNSYKDDRLHEFLEKSKMPFVITLQDFPRTKDSIYRDFPDVFSVEYEESSATFAEDQLAPFKDNPYLIGYFLTNEPEWLFQDSVNPAERVLASKNMIASKKALIEFLKDKYPQIDDLNNSWKTQFNSYADLENPVEDADTFSKQSQKDLIEFRDILIQKYCEVPSLASKKVAPNHMNLGMRYNRLSSQELAGNDFFSVCSFNCYRKDATDMLNLLQQENIEGPGLVGEWHVTATEERNFASGLVATMTQEERVKAFLYYSERALSHPNCVGIHYFEMNDQPLLGRFDGECMQHGLISICNVPYEELSQAMEELSGRLYNIVEGNVLPTTTQGVIYAYNA